MTLLIRYVTVLPIAWICAYGQVPDTPSFEVATIRPSLPATIIHCSGGPGTSSPGIWRCLNIPLAFLITRAYGFEAYQFSPRSSCCQARFDITAKVPEGTTIKQFEQMLQGLLVERLMLTLHHQQKEMPIYELTVGENGPKMKGSAAGAVRPQEDPWEPPTFSLGKDGYPVFLAGQSGLAGLDGHYRWTGFSVSMQDIAKTLSFQLGRPVVDATGLTGKYDINLTWNIDAAWLAEIAGARDQVENAADTGFHGPTLLRAVQDQLGLKLDQKRGLGDIVIIDHVEKVPIRN